MPVRWSSTVLPLVFSGFLASCMLLLEEPPTAGSHCLFPGIAQTLCGICIADQCQARVDGCCDDAACAGKLEPLDECAGRGAGPACSALLATPADGSALGALAACVRDRCGLLCPGGESVTRCDVGYDGADCSCSTGKPVNDTLCNMESVEDAVCCGDFGWPDRDLGCRCERFACRETEGGCECSVGGTGPKSSCTGPICCRSSLLDSCSCGEEDCSSSDTYLGTSCTRDNVGCFGDRGKTSGCSRRTE